jgi:tRNA pseudouridine55 synthase
MNFDFETGEVLLIDKPYEWSSFDVIRKVRNTIKIKKVGHAGTLDPLATGLLIVCTGKKTKNIEAIQHQEKEYTGEFILGKTTASYDLETEIIPGPDISFITPQHILDTALKFKGYIQQVPPVYSAIKVNGVRLYKKARKGQVVDVKPREVFIKEFVVEEISLPSVRFRVVCSKGTYIRSLAHDFGQALGVGAYLSSLRRTRIGDFSIKDSFLITEFVEKINLQKHTH